MFSILFLILFIGHSIALVEEIPLPNDLKVCFESLSRKSDMTKVPATEIQWICMQKSIWRLVDHSVMNISDQDRQWIDTILQIPDFISSVTTTSIDTGTGRRKKRQAATSLRIRTEYRLMNDLERDQYHRTVNRLKSMPIGNISRYDFIANIHRGDAIPVAHFSPNFLGWHRVYLLIYENALREIDPTVTVPYYASDLDDPMDDPTESVIWSDIFVGNGNGVVNNGPYANWKTQSGPLVRNIGAMGQLLSKNSIARILNNSRVEDISEPNGRYENCLERQHFLVNRWIGGGGGQMSDLNSASHDPIYFNHMAYVDYIWEQFRMIQHQQGINSATDYPTLPGLPGSGELMGFGNLQNIDGFSSFFTESVYTYEYLPECSRANTNCGSVYLRCDTSVSVPRCVSLTRKEWNNHLRATGQLGADAGSVNPGGFMFGQNPLSVALNENDICMSASRGIQNRYRSYDMTDIREWVYIPVEVVSRRPPEKSIYDSYPVFHGNVIYDGDVYSPDAYRVLRNTLHTVRLGKYDYCKDTSSNAGKVYIKSEGLNYYGTYQEYVIVDNRLALSSATGYVAVRSPELGMTQTFISAFDSCGRMCSAYCKMKGRKEYQPCHGALQMTSGTPRMYSMNFGEAVEETWEFYKNRYFPTVKDETVFIKFFCNYNEYWPKNIEKQPSVMSSQASNPQMTSRFENASPVAQNTQQQNRPPSQPQRNQNVMSNPSRTSNVSPSLRMNTGAQPAMLNNVNPPSRSNQQPIINPVNQMAPQPRVSQNTGRASSMTANNDVQNQAQNVPRNPGCLLGHGCVVSGACRSCTNGEKIPCLKSTTLFAQCQGNSLLIRRCLSNSRFDIATGNCRMK